MEGRVEERKKERKKRRWRRRRQQQQWQVCERRSTGGGGGSGGRDRKPQAHTRASAELQLPAWPLPGTSTAQWLPQGWRGACC